ncbi:hypothetical protein DM01DRAFT_57911 [Hesseltinella vesiculosa]|uniref:Uncharacterized protein n=1 Tax=Hesseltinella vesiculosa TaxID=101127 RepID=A0A1X2G5H6_9FUNG|nr:hypothetical protein DM01DRAFT_57911 [Hesseltinella vesiculosa]
MGLAFAHLCSTVMVHSKESKNCSAGFILTTCLSQIKKRDKTDRKVAKAVNKELQKRHVAMGLFVRHVDFTPFF